VSVLVFGYLRVFARQPLSITNSTTGTYGLLLAGYMVLAMPYMYRSIDAGLRAVDLRTLVEAAQSLGAGWLTIFVQVIFPIFVLPSSMARL
jgi:putative spermidine/putrescine transport system permease protein